MFKLDSRISKDSILVRENDFCQIRLQNDARYPWLVLVPKIADVTEVHELTELQQAKLISESSRAANVLSKITNCKKVNVANLGNVVAQLHWHIVARFEQDETWPGPIWGVGEAVPYEPSTLEKLLETLRQNLPVVD